MKSLASQLGLPPYAVIHCFDKEAAATIEEKESKSSKV
jgi:hypothetical protein